MTDAPSRSRGSTMGLRLALAFLGVALAAVALNAVLTGVFSAVDVSSLATRQRNALAGTLAVAAASAWEQHDSWADADLGTARALAAPTGTEFQVRDTAGHTVASSSGFTPTVGPTTSVPIVDSKGIQVGTVVVALTGSGLGGADAVLRTALLRAIAGTAGLAALLALIAGLGVSRRITRPVARLVSVTRAMASGDRSSRVGEINAPGE
ncbi:MAG TPA: HAMP domain-containing protein, partial [Actinospica sp.]|nr:HAMP domain-containing protein [Actinospica sp.]